MSTIHNNDELSLTSSKKHQGPSSPEAKAARLLRVRNLANLSQKEMCNDNELNIYNLRGWEAGKHGGLPEIVANLIIERVAREGVFCTAEWLLDEKGEPPIVIITPSEASLNNLESQAKNQLKIQEIERELAYFYLINPKAIHYKISDDTMLPHYEVGDVVAGLRHHDEKIDNLIGKACILQLKDHKTIFRKLHSKNVDGSYNIVTINSEKSNDKLSERSVEILCAASIIWHRKRST